jgi:hypothetical protein
VEGFAVRPLHPGMQVGVGCPSLRAREAGRLRDWETERLED